MVFVLCIFVLTACERYIANRDSKGKNIICFGDSITQGAGAQIGEDFPSLLSKKLDYPVLNAGRAGETTRDALKRLERDVLEHNPRMVIVEFGANDFLKKIPEEETFKNLDEIVLAIQKQGAMVVLAEVKIGLFFDEYYGGFKRIAQKRKALLIADIMRGIFTNPQLKSDGLHPNAEGYKIIAERIGKAVTPLLK